MSQLFTSQQHQREEAWCWPLNLDGCEKGRSVSGNRSAALQKLLVLTQGHTYPRTKQILQRLVRPIDDALTAIHASPLVCRETLRLMLFEMHRRGTTFWAWSLEEWQESLCSDTNLFAQRYGRVNRRSFARRHLPVLGYLLKFHPQLYRFVEMFSLPLLPPPLFSK